MKKLTILCLVLISLAASAENVTCTLQSEGKKASATVSIVTNEESVAIDEAWVNDLSFDLVSDCYESQCYISATIYSQILEDEAGQIGVEIERGEGHGRILAEPITHTPDGLNYFLYCYYNK